MVSTRNPDTMTEPQRRREISSLLAAALVRYVRDQRKQQSPPVNALDLSAQTRLSVGDPPHPTEGAQ
ncbi:MAG: hypothetical protein AAF085_00150 [Planctomycetota bacterium]